MGRGVSMKLNLSPSSLIRTERYFLEQHWNKKLSRDAHNPYPLAPKDLVRMGLVTTENYNLENATLSSYRNIVMENELTLLSCKPEFTKIVRPEVKVFGIGLARDLGWIEKAIHLGFYVTVYDISSVACDIMLFLAKSFAARGAPSGRLEVITGEIEKEWESVQSDQTLVVHASQFIQVQKKTKMRRVMRRLGLFLRDGALGIRPSLYLAHPFKKDNESPCEWQGISFPGVEWGDTTPYTEDELMRAMGRLHHSMKVDLLGVHNYYHQKYSILKIRYAVEG